MCLRLLPALVLTVSVGAALPSLPAAARKAQAGGAQPRPAGAKCELTPARSPMLYGFRLGMSGAEVAGRFPEFPELASIETARRNFDLKDASGENAIGVGKLTFGASPLSIRGRYLGPRLPPGERTGEFVSLDLLFLDGRLAGVHVRDWRSPEWKEIEGFKEWAARRFGFTGLAWRVYRPEVELPPGMPPDFLSDTHAIDCDGFTISASCVGPPGPPDLCDLRIRDSAVDKIIAARKAIAPKQE